MSTTRIALSLLLMLSFGSSVIAQHESVDPAILTQVAHPANTVNIKHDHRTYIQGLAPNTKVLVYLVSGREMIGRVRSRSVTDFDLSVGRSILTIPYFSVQYVERRRFWLIRFAEGMREFGSALGELFGILVLKRPV